MKESPDQIRYRTFEYDYPDPKSGFPIWYDLNSNMCRYVQISFYLFVNSQEIFPVCINHCISALLFMLVRTQF